MEAADASDYGIEKMTQLLVLDWVQKTTVCPIPECIQMVPRPGPWKAPKRGIPPKLEPGTSKVMKVGAHGDPVVHGN
ncbi:hypothetical protein NECAME_11852 [Necator americanus]|uniref:Uncharacterized protein n=1 Tax=Necator americanus TaxID=51031 RepID=W2T2H8_NECAM|nr:hypothetical protein NECAME_11852 [Necator americanus]ETN76210.1 hypothetical protein NECAME_11852 [Necator americanus]